MSKVIFWFLVRPFFYCVSLLPFPLLYLFSDFAYLIIYYVMGYRKKVVYNNLRNSFPDKTEAEIKKIRKAFFHYFCDLFLETFKTLTFSKKAAIKHCSFTPETTALLAKYAAENKSIILAMGHLGNWEWGGNTFSLLAPHQLYVIYHPITNKEYDELTQNMRKRFGTKLIAMKNTYKEMLAAKTELSATAFLSDQTPQPQSAYWTTFLNQDTPVFRGLEIISRKLNYPIIYLNIKKIKRGYYKMHTEVLCEQPANTLDHEISEMFTHRLEKDIIRTPENWLWSHRRWKHKRPVSEVK